MLSNAVLLYTWGWISPASTVSTNRYSQLRWVIFFSFLLFEYLQSLLFPLSWRFVVFLAFGRDLIAIIILGLIARLVCYTKYNLIQQLTLADYISDWVTGDRSVDMWSAEGLSAQAVQGSNTSVVEPDGHTMVKAGHG